MLINKEVSKYEFDTFNISFVTSDKQLIQKYKIYKMFKNTNKLTTFMIAMKISVEIRVSDNR